MARPQTQHALADEMAAMARDGASSHGIGRKFGISGAAVRTAVRKTIPNAFLQVAAHVPPANAVARAMPHNVGYSTGLPSHHSISLPRLRCLATDTA
jgi:hypothetical protein